MPEKTLNEVFSEIADAIREKSESSETLKPINMATAIEEIPTGPSLDNDSLYTVDGSGAPTKVAGNACVVTTESGSPVIRSDVHSGYYYSTFDNEEDHALDFEQLETNTYINGSGSTRTLDIYSTYYVSGESGGDAKFLTSGYYHIIDGDSNEPSILEGLDGANVYRFNGDATFEVLSSFPQEDGYYYYASNDSQMFTPAVGAEEGSYYYIWHEELRQQDLTEGYYHYSNDSAALTPYTPGPTPEKGKYYYGNTLTAQTLNSETLYWKGYGDNSSLTSVNLTSGNAYKYSGDTSFYEIRYFPESFGWYYYGMSGSDEFSRTKLADGLYQIDGANGYNFNLTANNYYQYTVNGQGRMAFTPYTPSGSGEPGKYYYGTTDNVQAQTLETGYYQFTNSNASLQSYTPEPSVSTEEMILPLEACDYELVKNGSDYIILIKVVGKRITNTYETLYYYRQYTPSDITQVIPQQYEVEIAGRLKTCEVWFKNQGYISSDFVSSDLDGYNKSSLVIENLRIYDHASLDIFYCLHPTDQSSSACIQTHPLTLEIQHREGKAKIIFEGYNVESTDYNTRIQNFIFNDVSMSDPIFTCDDNLVQLNQITVQNPDGCPIDVSASSSGNGYPRILCPMPDASYRLYFNSSADIDVVTFYWTQDVDSLYISQLLLDVEQPCYHLNNVTIYLLSVSATSHGANSIAQSLVERDLEFLQAQHVKNVTVLTNNGSYGSYAVPGGGSGSGSGY